MGMVEERIILKYYNRVLFEKGLITERERNLMAVKIASRRSKRRRTPR